MSLIEKTNLISQISIAAQIIDGSLVIDSTDEFEDILKLFPNDPSLLRAYADLLLERRQPAQAAEYYEKAAALFVDSGFVLQAMVSKSLQWRMQPPSKPTETRQFFTRLKKGSPNETALNVFFYRLPYAAIISILNRLVKVRLPAGRMIKKVGDEENYLYFIISGTVRKTTFEPQKKENETIYKKSTVNLSESDFFGDIYPFEESKFSLSYIETITQVEFVKISKINLMKTCMQYPDVELGIKHLYGAKSDIGENESSPTLRRSERHQLPIRTKLEVNIERYGNQPIMLEGYSKDFSIGGACVVLDTVIKHVSEFCDSIKNVKTQLSMISEDLTLNVSGVIIWSREVCFEDEKIVALGVQFKEMPPRSQGILFAFADSFSNRQLLAN
jgi:CRP-like cAMP-binding protein